MDDAADMSTPVTRGELRAELQQLRLEIQQAVAPLATKVELELWGGALLARMAQMHQELRQELRQELQSELARHVGAFQEWTQSMIRSLDDKYADLPPRVRRLESAVFEKKSRRAPRRRPR
jgi:hypothetical protein